MSFWVRTFCQTSVANVTPEQLRQGIAKRLKLLTYLFCPDDEEEPDAVLARLRIENCSATDKFEVFLLHFRTNGPFIRVERWQGTDTKEEVQERMELLEGKTGATAEQIRQKLMASTESIAFDLKLSHVQGMGWPLAIAGAACLAEVGNGIIQAEGSGWMLPAGNEVRVILRED